MNVLLWCVQANGKYLLCWRFCHQHKVNRHVNYYASGYRKNAQRVYLATFTIKINSIAGLQIKSLRKQLCAGKHLAKHMLVV